MGAEYEGTIVQNEQYKVKKLQMQLKQMEVAYNHLERENKAMKESHALEVQEYKQRISRYIAAEIKPVKGRLKGFKPRPRKVAEQ